MDKAPKEDENKLALNGGEEKHLDIDDTRTQQVLLLNTEVVKNEVWASVKYSWPLHTNE